METGLDRFLKTEHRKYKKLQLAFLCNQASVDQRLLHLRDLVLEKKLKLDVRSFFGPQHGIRGEKQDNMIETDDFTDPISGKRVYSLYGKSREPSAESLKDVDAIICDLQDIGTRIYTFMYTIANVMRVAAKLKKKVVILDRPNPIGGDRVEGPMLDPKYASFVGQYPIVVRHGMTMGELALLFNEAFGIGCDLEIVLLKGWKRKMYGDEWGRDWVPPSPNIPVFESSLFFPGGVFFEGTNVSEGRGTTKPFEWIGAPWIDPDALSARLNKLKVPGVYYRPIFFQPTFHKGKEQLCGGVQLHATDKRKLDSTRAGVELLAAILDMYPKDFAWKQPPYEYEYEKLPIDLIAGGTLLRELCEARGGLKKWFDREKNDVAAFNKLRSRYLLYKNGGKK